MRYYKSYIFIILGLFNLPLFMSQPADHSAKTLETYGWTPVPHDTSVLLKDISPWDPAICDVTDIQVPHTELAEKVHRYAKERLPEAVYRHSMRVYFYGKNTFPPDRCNDRQLKLT